MTDFSHQHHVCKVHPCCSVCHSFLLPNALAITSFENQTSFSSEEAVPCELGQPRLHECWVWGPRPEGLGSQGTSRPHRGQTLSSDPVPPGQVVFVNNQRYMAAIILSEKQCQEQLKETNKSCNGEWPGQQAAGVVASLPSVLAAPLLNLTVLYL